MIDHAHGFGQVSRLCVHEKQNTMTFVQIVESVTFLFDQQTHDSCDRGLCVHEFRNKNIDVSSKLSNKNSFAKPFDELVNSHH